MNKKDKTNINSDGGPIFLGKVNNKGEIKGRSDQYYSGIDMDEVSKLFDNLFAQIDKHSKLSKDDKADIRVEIQEVRQELTKKEDADESFIMRRLRNIGRMAPDILESTLALIIHPALGLGVIAKKIAEKARSAA